MSQDLLKFEELLLLIKEKITQKDENSYTYFLTKSGIEKITRKIGEEALEVVIGAFAHEKNRTQKTRDELVGELCDLFYHSLVLLASEEIELSEIFAEFHKRNNAKSLKK